MGTELVPKKSTMDQAMELVTVETKAKQEHLMALVDMRSALLPIEEGAKDDLDARIAEARADVHQDSIGYPRMSLEPLRWRHGNGLPKLVLMSLNSPTVVFTGWYTGIGDGGAGCSVAYPPDVTKCYEDVLDYAKGFCWRNGSKMEFIFTFDGLIPNESRVKIAEAMQSKKFDAMWLLVEAPQEAWQKVRTKGKSRRKVIQEKVSSIDLDPVVIGQAHDTLFVIDRFDLTTVEQYVVDEFSQLALPPGE